jgi:hypothetical protein
MSDNAYVDKITGEQVRIISENDTFYVLDNTVSIKKDVFSKKYEKDSGAVDVNSFFNTKPTNDPLLNVAQQLLNMDTSKISDNPNIGGTQVKYVEKPMVIADSSMSQAVVKQPQMEAPIQLTKEQREAMLEQFRNTMEGAKVPIVQQKYNNYDDEDERLLNGDNPQPNNIQIPKEPVNPLESMFKMFKNNYTVKLNLNFDEKIPNPNFIGMVQDNVEADAIDYYANLISKKILSDPNILKDEIYKQLKAIINKELGIEEEITEIKEEKKE